METKNEEAKLFGDYPVGTVLLVPVTGRNGKRIIKCRVEYTDKDSDACTDCVLHNEPDAACIMFNCVTGNDYKILREITNETD